MHASPNFKSPGFSEKENSQMRQALRLSLQIIVHLGKELNRYQQTVNDNQFLNQLEDIDSIPSLIDLLKFINTDQQMEMIKYERIQ